MAGIGLGVAALITVLSVMNGFQREVRDRMLSVIPHIEVFSSSGSMPDWADKLKLVKQNPRVSGAAPFVTGQAMASRDDVLRGVITKGILPESESAVSDLAKQMKAGSLANLAEGQFGIVIGRDLARATGAQLNDKLTLIAPQGTVTPAGFQPRLRAFTIVGIFESGHSEYDAGLVLMHLADAAKFFRVDGASGIRLKTTDMNSAPQIAQELVNQLPADAYARDWSKENQIWFSAVQVEKRMMFIILTLIIAVAAFNLVSMLVMTVTEKRPDIAILKTLGASPRSVQIIFMVQGALIGWLGTLLGVFAGVLLSLNIGKIIRFFEDLFGFQVLPKGIYLINHLPSELRWPDVFTIALTSFVLALLATIYPSRRAAAVQPAQALRYE